MVFPKTCFVEYYSCWNAGRYAPWLTARASEGDRRVCVPRLLHVCLTGPVHRTSLSLGSPIYKMRIIMGKNMSFLLYCDSVLRVWKLWEMMPRPTPFLPRGVKLASHSWCQDYFLNWTGSRSPKIWEPLVYRLLLCQSFIVHRDFFIIFLLNMIYKINKGDAA